jgi:hypothetical protein
MPAMSKQLFKKKNGEIKFSVNDILNQNQSITRNNGDNYIEDVRSMVLKTLFYGKLPVQPEPDGRKE